MVDGVGSTQLGDVVEVEVKGSVTSSEVAAPAGAAASPTRMKPLSVDPTASQT
jgi:hypothetical protein